MPGVAAHRAGAHAGVVHSVGTGATAKLAKSLGVTLIAPVRTSGVGKITASPARPLDPARARALLRPVRPFSATSAPASSSVRPSPSGRDPALAKLLGW